MKKLLKEILYLKDMEDISLLIISKNFISNKKIKTLKIIKILILSMILKEATII